MNLTEAMVATLLWGLTAVGVLQIWVTSGHALADAQKRQQALEAIDADLLRFGASLQRQRSEPSGSATDCGAVVTAWSAVLAARRRFTSSGLAGVSRAVVSQTCFPSITGDDHPRPGSAVFQAMPSFSLQRIGG